MIGDTFQPRRRLRASQLNELARSADSAHLGAAGFLSQENGLEQVARSPRRTVGKRNEKIIPLDYFDCRILSDANGASHLCCYVPDTTYAVVVDQSRTDPATMSWFGNDGKWIDLGTISTNEDYIAYLGFVDAGVNEYPRWLWKVFLSSDLSGYMEPTMDASVVWTHPVVPICRLLDGKLAQLHRGQLSVIGKWFVVGNNGIEARLTLRGTNGSDIAYIDDNDASPDGKSFALASGVPFSAPAGAAIGGDLTIGGKLNGEKPVWKNITIDGTSYTILCKAASRP